MAGWHHYSMDVSLGELRELVMDREVWHTAIHGVTKSRTQSECHGGHRFMSPREGSLGA